MNKTLLIEVGNYLDGFYDQERKKSLIDQLSNHAIEYKGVYKVIKGPLDPNQLKGSWCLENALDYCKDYFKYDPMLVLKGDVMGISLTKLLQDQLDDFSHEMDADFKFWIKDIVQRYEKENEIFVTQVVRFEVIPNS